MSDKALAKELAKMPYELQHAVMQHILRREPSRVSTLVKYLNRYRGGN